MNLSALAAFALYSVITMCIGLYFASRKNTVRDFMLGNRSVNYWVTALSTQTSDMGAWLFMGFPAVIYTGGLFGVWVAIGLIIGMWLTWRFIAPPLRSHTATHSSLTLPSFFAAHCGDPYGLIRLVGAFFIVLFSTFYIASGLMGLSKLFESVFGINYHTGIMVSLAASVLYTAVGGFLSIAWCNFFQGLFLLGTIIIVPLCAFFALPEGIHSITTAAASMNISLSPLSSLSDTTYALVLALGWGLGYCGQPHILLNFMGIDDVKKLRFAERIGISWLITVLLAAIAVGLIGIGLFSTRLADPELIFIAMASQLFKPFLAGIIVCAIIAAALSSKTSLILVSGSTIAQDIWPVLMRYAGKDSTIASRYALLVSRIGIGIASLASLVIAWKSTDTIFNIVEYAWAGLGSSIGPMVCTTLYMRNVPWYAALAGMITGGSISALWPYTSPLVPGFFGGLAVILIISFMFPKTSKKMSK